MNPMSAIDFSFLTRIFAGFSKQEQRLSAEEIEKVMLKQNVVGDVER